MDGNLTVKEEPQSEDERNFIVFEAEAIDGKVKEEIEENKVNFIKNEEKELKIIQYSPMIEEIESSKPLKNPIKISYPHSINKNNYHPRSFKCTHCDRKYIDLKRLNNHLLTHQNKCNVCDRVFVFKLYLENHICTYCKICNKKWKEKTEFLEHLKIHQKKNPDGTGKVVLVCFVCKREFASRQLLKAHTVHRSRGLFLCKECPKSFKTKIQLKRHDDVHDKKFECEICKKRFSINATLQNHKKFHQNPEQFQCKICLVTVTTLVYLKHHMKAVHKVDDRFKFSCEKCNYETYRELFFENHKKKHEKLENILKSRTNWIRCEKCPFSVFSSNDFYEKHVRIFHSNLHFECDFCEFTSKIKIKILQHLKKNHFFTEVSLKEEN